MQGKRAPRKNLTNAGLKEFVEILPMAAENIEAVKKIEIECKLSPWNLKDYESEIENKYSLALISKNKNAITGFLLARLIMQENSETDKFREAEIYNIGVKEEFRKSGIAQALLDCFLKRAKIYKISKIWLEVRESNAPAINFYKKNNFFTHGKRKNFYHSPTENACVMSLDLSDRK